MIENTTHEVFYDFDESRARQWRKVANANAHRKFLSISGNSNFELIFGDITTYGINFGGGKILIQNDNFQMTGIVHKGEIWARCEWCPTNIPNLTVIEITQTPEAGDCMCNQ